MNQEHGGASKGAMSRALIVGVVFACSSCAAHRAGLEREAVTLATDGNERFVRHLERVTAALPSAPLSLPRRPATDFDGPRHELSGLDLREDGEGRLGLAMGPGRGCGSVVPPDEVLFSTQPDGKLRITVVSAAITERVIRVADPCGMAGCGASASLHSVGSCQSRARQTSSSISNPSRTSC